MRYTLDLTEDQADVLLSALDLYSRLLTGQVQVVGEVLSGCATRFPSREAGGGPLSDRLRRSTDEMRSALGFSPGEGFPLLHPDVDERAKAAYDIQQSVRYGVAWSRAGKSPERDARPSILLPFDEPRRTTADSLRFPLPFFRIVKSAKIIEDCF